MVLPICLFFLLSVSSVVCSLSSNSIIDVTLFGAVGDGVTDDTRSIAKALQAAQELKGPVEVLFPFQKTFLMGPLNMSSSMTLVVDGTLLAKPGSLHVNDWWPQIPPLPSYGRSEDGPANQYQAFVYARDASDIRITGLGTIDGQGEWWWDNNHNSSLITSGRPSLVQLVNCTNVEISGVTMKDPAWWCLHPVYCNNVHIHHMKIRARMYAPNTDGIDPDSCRNVMIEHNDVSCGDDHIAIKSGRCGDPSTSNKCHDKPFVDGTYETNNVTVRYNIFHIGMGIAIGSESSGSIRNIDIHDNVVGLCDFGHCENTCCGWGPALHLKTALSRGGVIENVVFRNNIVYNTSLFILMELDYQSGQEPPTDHAPTKVQNISFIGNQALGGAMGASWHCNVKDVCEDIAVINNTVKNADHSPWGCQYVHSYHVSGNSPPGLEDCMKNSMNRTVHVRDDTFTEIG